MALSRNTAIIRSPRDVYIGFNSGSINIFDTRDYGTWEKLQKLTFADVEANDWLGKL